MLSLMTQNATEAQMDANVSKGDSDYDNLPESD